MYFWIMGRGGIFGRIGWFDHLGFEEGTLSQEEFAFLQRSVDFAKDGFAQVARSGVGVP